MEISQILDIALPVVYVLVGVALVWLLIELVATLRKTRKTVDTVQKQVEPTLKSVENITASAESMMEDLNPTIAKVDPLVERVALTVDAANLELMRLDKILEDVGEVTDTVSTAAQTVDAVTSAPFDLINKVSSGVRNAFKPQHASEESIGLGEQKNAEPSSSEDSEQSEKDLFPDGLDLAAGVVGFNDQDEPQDEVVEEEDEAPKYFTYSYAENLEDNN